MGMHTSWAKTKIQNVGLWILPAAVIVNGHNIDTTERFTYLGSDVDSSGYSSPDILAWVVKWLNTRLLMQRVCGSIPRSPGHIEI